MTSSGSLCRTAMKRGIYSAARDYDTFNARPRLVAKHQMKDGTLQRLRSFSTKDSPAVQKLRQKAEAAPSDTDVQIAFAQTLTRAGCTYEAASILRPLGTYWKSSQHAELAAGAVAAQAWWNKNGRQFIRLRRSDKADTAMALLGDRFLLYWDLPPLLMHLGEIAADNDQLDLASHLFQRVEYLCERGVPKMSMKAFRYVSQAALVDLMARSGKIDAALNRHRAIVPNSGNAMAHEIQHISLLVAARRVDEAMLTTASILVTAQKHRTGYSKRLRIEFIETSPDLAPLRKARRLEIAAAGSGCLSAPHSEIMDPARRQLNNY